MAVTAYKGAGSGVDDSGVGTLAWVSDDFSAALAGTEVSSDDNVYAGTIQGGNTTSHYLKCTNFSFTSGDVPSGATINGFEIEVRQFRTVAIIVASTLVKFVKAGSVVGNDIGTATDWATSETVVTYGSSTELGGQSWTQSDVTASNFGCVISLTTAVVRTSPSGRSHEIDQVRIRVYYTAATSGLTGVATLTGVTTLTM
jgi:hypothetical protein